MHPQDFQLPVPRLHRQDFQNHGKSEKSRFYYGFGSKNQKTSRLYNGFSFKNRKKFKKSKVVWESGEQAGAANASEKTLADLKDANELYERRYGFIFLVCATGKVFVFLYFSFS